MRLRWKSSYLFIHQEREGVLSMGRVWVGMIPGYLYIADTLPGLLWQMITEWKHDRHLAG